MRCNVCKRITIILNRWMLILCHCSSHNKTNLKLKQMITRAAIKKYNLVYLKSCLCEWLDQPLRCFLSILVSSYNI